jgi:hypothetical protein
MRYALLTSAIILAACTVPPMEQAQETKTAPVSPEIKITAPRTVQPQPAPKPKPPQQSPCVDIATGDPTEDVRAKLDCLKEHGTK